MKNEKLLKILKDKGLTIAEAARQMGLSRSYLSAVVNGKRVPGRATAYRISLWTRMEMSPVELMFPLWLKN